MCATVLAAAASPAGARVQFQTPELVVNTHTTGVQFGPSVVAEPNGSFIVVWNSLNQEGALNSYAGVFGRRFDASGAGAATEFLVNTYTTYSQFEPHVGRSLDGQFVVVWTSFHQNSTDYGIFGQRFDVDGTRIGDEFRSDVSPDTPTNPAVAVGHNGLALVLWRRFARDVTNTHEIFARLVDGSGTPLGQDFQVNSYTTSMQLRPAACTSINGDFMVVWQSGNNFEAVEQDGSGSGLFGQRLRSDGVLLGTEFPINVTTAYAQFYPSVACRFDGTFVVGWGSYDPARGLSEGAFIRRFAEDGAPLGTEMQLNPLSANRSAPSRARRLRSRVRDHELFILPDPSPSIAAAPTGDFVVVWEAYQPDDFYGVTRIAARAFAPSGEPRGTEFQVNTYPDTHVYYPHIDASGVSDFVVAWTSSESFASYGEFQDGDGPGIVARKFSVLPDCGDADRNAKATAADALVVLREALGSTACEPCVCDVDGSGQVTSGDALSVLRNAVGLATELSCLDC